MNKEERKKRSKKLLVNVILIIVLPILASIILDEWYYGVIYLAAFFVKKLIVIKKRGYFAKDIYGEELSFKQFMKRWKAGIEGITPLQQAKTTLMGTWIVISGIIGGMGVMAIVRPADIWWWSEIILLGSLIITGIQLLSGVQKYWKFKEQDKIQKEFERQLGEKK